ncbi:Dipeptidyl aminopeptidase/acylaminoacyl peptidase [Aquimarina amphilecti]|uniref:Dipeptidyl aminopeptidase/acylaminoacyl peptidase n=2 Tax=Aquimarina amphilecti TaxID=1038014 RepID=A0A1H7K1C7_AQUAM|nr:Dipeptidyl aminopeptidase/acylaminoacyl peptidase [Aquimarina amphilecti]
MRGLRFKQKRNGVLLCTMFISLTILAQELQLNSGYNVKEYLSQISVNTISISPNGNYIAVITSNDDIEENTTEKMLWHYEINDEGELISKTKIDFFSNTISQLNWTNDSRYLIFKAKDSIGYSLFKALSKSPKKITPILKEREKFKELSSYKILDSTTLIFLESKAKNKEKGQKDILSFPKTKNEIHTTFKKMNFETGKIDSLFTLESNVVHFDISPDQKHMIYANYNHSSYFDNNSYADSHTYIIDATNGSLKKQLTDDYVWDESNWFGEDKILSFFNGNPEKKHYNPTFNGLCIINPNNGNRKKLDNFKGRISSYITLNNSEIIINAQQSTTSNFYTYKNDHFERISDHKGTISNFKNNKNKSLMAFTMITNSSFEEVYIARTIEELNNPIRISDFNSSLSAQPIPEIEKISWKNSSGETIEGVLMWPPGKKGVQNLPFVVDIHGGPRSSRSEAISLGGLHYYYAPSLLASKGFLVLLPNYRGSTGRGQEFMEALNGHPSSKPSDDILTGVTYVIDKKWANKDKMIIKGASYGGHLTNWIIGNTDIFKVALPSCGIWNERASYGTGDGDIGQLIKFNQLHYWDNPELFDKESAFLYAKNIKTPTLITHGGKDVRVPTHNAYAMYYTLKEQGATVELLIYKNEGHIYRKPHNKLHKVEAELLFIEKHLGN